MQTRMSQKQYESCKHNDAWRQDALSFYNLIKSPGFHKALEKNPEHQKSLEGQQKYIDFVKREVAYDTAANKAANDAYVAKRKEQEEEYVNTLPPEQKEDDYQYKEQHRHIHNSQQIVDNQINEVIATMAEQGVTPDNYEEKTSGLGDVVNKALSKFGLTSDSMEKLLGLHGGCGCDKRKKFLNKILPFSKKE